MSPFVPCFGIRRDEPYLTSVELDGDPDILRRDDTAGRSSNSYRTLVSAPREQRSDSVSPSYIFLAGSHAWSVSFGLGDAFRAERGKRDHDLGCIKYAVPIAVETDRHRNGLEGSGTIVSHIAQVGTVQYHVARGSRR